MSLPEVLQRAKRPEQVVTVCFDAELLEQYSELSAGLKGSLAEGAKTPEMEELSERIHAASYPFRLRAAAQGRIAQLAMECPPRPGNPVDEQSGHDSDRYNELLLRESIVDPVIESDEEWAELLEKLTSGQYVRLAIEANKLALADGRLPLSLTT